MQNVIEQVASGAALTAEHFQRDVLAGLSQSVKTIPCKYLYDKQGAQLFEAICELEEYYPTRTEMGILRRNIKDIARLLGRGCHLVDLGSGSGTKTRLLLEHLEAPASCTPVDVSREQLLDSAERLAAEWPDLEVWPVCADYTHGFHLPHLPRRPERITVFFPGSTIGNFEPGEAVGFLRQLGSICGPRAGLLLGVDLRKDPHVLHAAYNDGDGVTAAFNLNLLVRANRELGANFEVTAFRHQAVFNDREGRIEMHLFSRRVQRVAVAGQEFYFAAGESIVTEHSYKYRLDEFHCLAAQAGFDLVRCWTDEAHWFSVNYFRARREQHSAAAPSLPAAERRGAAVAPASFDFRGVKRSKGGGAVRLRRQR